MYWVGHAVFANNCNVRGLFRRMPSVFGNLRAFKYWNAVGSKGESTLAVANPRLLVHLSARASCQIVEEFVSSHESSRHFTNAAAEIWLEEKASLRHGYAAYESHLSCSTVRRFHRCWRSLFKERPYLKPESILRQWLPTPLLCQGPYW